MDQAQQELMMKFSMFEQQIKHLQEQMQAVEKAHLDLESIDLGLDEIKTGKDKELLAPIGRGIFVKTKLISDELTVDVGGKNFVTKDVESTKALIKKQIEKLGDVQKQLDDAMGNINEELTKLMLESQAKQAGQNESSEQAKQKE